MPKKKIQNKGKSKQSSEEKDDSALRKNENEDTDNEYKTVVDSEANKKYSKRVIQSNWSKYEEDLSHLENEDEKDFVPKTDDFNHLIKTASSDCSHFQFSTEKLWEKEETSVPLSNIFNLDLNILSSGLACVPFYERIGLDEKYLSLEDKQRLDAAAEKSQKEYALLRGKLFRKVEDEPNAKYCENLRTLNESFRDKLDVSVKNEAETAGGPGKIESAKTDVSLKQFEVLENIQDDKIKGEKKSAVFFSENDEDLEDWLDSVLDD